MKAENFNLTDYLSRIGFDGEVSPDVATLVSLPSSSLGVYMLVCIPNEDITNEGNLVIGIT